VSRICAATRSTAPHRRNCGASDPRQNNGAARCLDVGARPLAHEFGDAPTMTVGDVALVAQKADAAAGAHERGKFVELLLRVGRCDVRLIDAEELLEPALPSRLAPFAWRAERSQVQIADALLVERGGELAL
jgi:hypothetical protein